MSALLVKQAGDVLGPFPRSEVVRMIVCGELADADLVKGEEAARWCVVKEWAALYVPERERRANAAQNAGMSAGDQALVMLQHLEAARTRYTVLKRSPALGAVFSLIFPGAGQFYAGAPWHGVGYLLLIGVVFLAWLQGHLGDYGFWGLSLLSCIDAVLLVEKANKRLAAKLGLFTL